jgi:hypothetical protein
MASRGVRDDGRGGARRMTRTLRERAVRLTGHRVKIGVFGGTSGDGFQMPEVAAVHEYGSRNGHVPQRSFLRSTLENKRTQIAEMSTRLGSAVVAGNTPARQALEALGQMVAAEVKKTITAGAPLQPPLSPETVAWRARGSKAHRRKSSGPILARPLVHTGQLVQSITHVVEAV